MVDRDLHHSLERVVRNEDHKAQSTGFGTNKQGRAIVRQYSELLAAGIAADRKNARHDRVVSAALRGVDDQSLASHLLIAGVSVCYAEGLGVDDDGRKNYRDIALCIGRCLNQKKGRLALKVGGWGVNMLVTALPTLFTLDDDCVLTLPLTDDLDDFLNGIVECAAKTSPYLLPFATPPAPWTQYWKGGVPPGHWAHVPLISERHPAIEGAVRDAIGKRRMDDVLDAINSMQNVPFTINKAMVDYIRREPEEPIPAAPDPESSPGKQWLAKQKRNEAAARKKARQMDLAIAEFLAHRGRFYVSLNMDFRGRLYGIPHFNFARDDRVPIVISLR